MNIFGLIGYPLSHSFSSHYFTEKFFRENIQDCKFEAFPIKDISELTALIESTPGIKGLSVTIPYKESVLPLLTEIDETALQVGAVNCIKISGSKKNILIGYNTDIFGFEESLKPLLKNHHEKALIMGSGGAAKAVAFVLNKLGIHFQFVTRAKNELADYLRYEEVTEQVVLSHTLIVNASPAGMYPEMDTFPEIPYHSISDKHILYDLVYNPLETIFMKRGSRYGARVKNGLEMLYLQAEKSWSIWNQ